jgi:demethylmenaquinone methyltransferase/2-methoxy-6-polyprenyl-1,4-benzoquinol methylase
MGFLEDKRRARLFYRFLSKVYDRVNPFVWNEDMRAEALDRLGLEPEDRVLDVGCGTGFGTAGLLQETDSVHGLDQSIHQLRRAWAKLGKHDPVSFTLGDAERLPYADDAFDAVWSSGSIEYWPDPVATLEECARVTRPGGTVLVVGPNAPSNPLVRRLAKAVMLFYDEAEADRMFDQAGFEAFEHLLIGPSYRPEIAIVTLAAVPE